MRVFIGFKHILESLMRSLLVLEFMNALLFASALDKLSWQSWGVAYLGCTLFQLALLYLRKHLSLLPYGLLSGLFLVGLFLLPWVSLLVKIFLCVSLVVGALKPITSFERIYFAIPALLFILHGVQNDDFGKILDLFFSLTLMLIALTWNFSTHFLEGQLLGKSTFYFSEKKYVGESFHLFRRQLMLLASLGLLLILGTIFTRPFTTFSGFKTPAFQEEETLTSASSETLTSEVQTTQESYHLQDLGKENKFLADFWKVLEKVLIVGFWLALSVGLVGLVLYGFYLLYRQLKGIKKEETEDLLENSDIVLDLGGKRKTTRLSFFGTPQMRLRQKYRRLFKKKSPKISSTPQEQLNPFNYPMQTKEELQKLYEKARYSKAEITKEDYQKFKDFSKQKED